ncbi:MAG: arginine deiminase-related protein [Bacteroidota bacterium]
MSPLPLPTALDAGGDVATLPLSQLPALPRPSRVVLTAPDYFEVAYVINPHMAGNLGTVDRARARAQWDALRTAYAELGLDVHTLDGQPGLPDMVFCANQVLPYQRPDGTRGAILSRMHAEQRKPEVKHYADFFRDRGYEVHALDPDLPGDFEGMGDALWHPGRFLLWGGYGYRTDRTVYERFAAKLGFPVIPLRLVDPDFYHLDTCLCPLDEHTALYYPGAFDDEGRALIAAHFERALAVPEAEARDLFACNAHSPNSHHVLIQRGCTETVRMLRAHGYTPVELDTSEFLKAGGSVFCMKNVFW